MVLFGPGFDKIVILGIISIPYNFRSCLFYYLALLALSEIASVRLCGLLFWYTGHPAFKREDRLGKEPFAGFGTVVEDITESGYTKNQPILLGPF